MDFKLQSVFLIKSSILETDSCTDSKDPSLVLNYIRLVCLVLNNIRFCLHIKLETEHPEIVSRSSMSLRNGDEAWEMDIEEEMD